ncbi:hypothetical protein [Actinomadura geliboluensis]|uniref:Uncharacterized protein n=1 Tax=Actinomadura geliboluensis TaxID=882440 RepID=A0A5S4FTR5_9ACTN|nr:hypothetical protein [Actinomadura geliboluensis]TMR24012.1 hypothetical protein ETD96_43295 [Actinomadura geliboluensis]
MWIQLFRYVTFAVISAAVGLVGALDGDVPVVFAPFFVAVGTAFVNSAVLTLATAAALGGRRPSGARRVAFGVWAAGVIGTLAAVILVLGEEHGPSVPLIALLAVPFLLVAKPPRHMLLDPAPRGGAPADGRRPAGTP